MDNDGTPEPPRRSTGNNLPVAPQQHQAAPGATAPLIPLNVIDAPTQRFYALAIYVALFAWKFYDWAGLVEENSESFWLFLKWIAIDCVFLFGLPELRIPWLELSQPFVVALFFCHAIFDWMLMFNVGLPWQGWILGFVRVFYDRELAISEHNVKVSNILHNSSLIMGRQVINILPEGTAELNPEGASFCLGGDAHRKVAMLPMYFNATVPVEVELIRQDFDPESAPEHIKLSRSQLREIERKAKSHSQDGAQAMVQFDFPVKKTGVYRLAKVLDEYKLEVHRRTPQTFVVTCPRAWVGPAHGSGRCISDLSDVTLQVEGTPPLRIVYSRTVNGKDGRFQPQSLQPDGFSSPLTGSILSSAVVAPDGQDVSWARAQQIPFALNESMHTSGEWQYSIDKVTDGFGNEQEYASPIDDPEGKPKAKNLVQNFLVKERPQIRLEGCDLRNPLKVAKGESKELPVRFAISGQTPDDTAHSLTWLFSPIDTLTEDGDHGDVVSLGSYSAKNARDRPRISASGLYTLRSVTAGSCEGEVQEPASCLLLNPLEPKLTIRSEEIPDTCAGNSVGLQVAMDFIGTPPFTVRYDMITNGARQAKKIQVPGLRYQMDLIPWVAGHHKYVFTHIEDDIYKGQKLTGSEFVLEQDVKPAAGAIIQHSSTKVGACLGDKAEVNVLLLGDVPFTLEWEVIHDGKRKHRSASGIEDNHFKIQTTPLVQGGEYTIALKSVQDKRGCKNLLQEEIKVAVRMQSPRAAFGQLQHKRTTMAVEGSLVKLPVRLTGEGPWKVYYTNNDGDSTKETKIFEKSLRNDNDFLEVRGRGVFTITDVWDSQCHGIVDSKASTFQVEWYPRPQLAISPSQVISHTDDMYVLDAVCEGEVSGFEIDLKGTPPYNVKYDVVHTPLQGSGSPKYRKELDTQAARVSIPGDTAKAGTYKYKFSAVADNLYDHAANFQPLVVQQKVNKKPAAAFVKPGQTFKFCKTDEGETEGITVTLSGVPPFSLDVEIKHHSAAAPEIYRTPSIKTNTYEIRIPKHHLRLGTQHIRIRDVKDGSGCHSVADLGGAGAVQVQLYEAPTIYPLETRTDYCVGERLSYTLSGTPPFEVWYTFDGTERKAKSPTTNFRRIAESPGEFAITTVSDKASECRAPVNIVKNIHPMPAVKISKGKNVQVDIHEGSEVEILFEFWGTPPFEFTYTRSTNARKGQKVQVLETRHDVSHEHSKVVRANQEGTYEVVAIKDKYCAFSTQATENKGGKEQKARKYLQGA